MGCRPGMVGCRTPCGHREIVSGYYAARDGQLAAAETLAGWAGRDDPDRPQVITFKEWLIGNRCPEEWCGERYTQT